MIEDHAPPAYRALAFQVRCETVNADRDPDSARARMRATLARLEGQLAASLRFQGPDTRLVVLPEYFLTGFPTRESAEEWIAKACIRMDGPELEAISAMADRLGVFLSGNSYEDDPLFPGHYFQTSWLVSDTGEPLLRYRRLNTMFATSPHDVWDAYLDRYGLDAVFPVADTPLGRIAAIASEEILYPEVARCAAMRGAEVFLHSSSEIYRGEPTEKDIAKRARAQENMAYVVSANSAGIEGISIPAGSVDGGSQIVDHTGRVLTRSGPGESLTACAEIDLAALRRFRRRPGMGNVLSRQRFEAYAAHYAAASFYPNNTLADRPFSRTHAIETQKRTIEALVDDGVIS